MRSQKKYLSAYYHELKRENMSTGIYVRKLLENYSFITQDLFQTSGWRQIFPVL